MDINCVWIFSTILFETSLILRKTERDMIKNVFLVNDQLDALFLMYLFHACMCFEQRVLIIRRAKLY
jgi:hypothetical protein